MTPSQEKKYVLILSTGRTGTVFLSHLFGHMLGENAVVRHEGEGKERIINILTNMYFAGAIPRRWVQEYLRGYLQRNTQISAGYYIGAGPYMYGAPYIAPDLFKNYKVIHIIRDPRDFVTSVINYIYTLPRSFIVNKFFPFWLPPRKDKHFKHSIFRNTHKEFDEYCWGWRFKNTYIEKFKPHAKATMTITFEEIFNTGQREQAIEKMLHFVGFQGELVPIKPSIIDKNVSRNIKMEPWVEWDNAMCYRLYVYCGELMKQYGYGNEEQWIDKVERGKKEYY